MRKQQDMGRAHWLSKPALLGGLSLSSPGTTGPHKTTEQSTRNATRPTVVRWTCTTQEKVPQGPFWKERVTGKCGA